MRILWLALAAVAMAITTTRAGWWTVPVVAAVAALAIGWRERGVNRSTPRSAALGLAAAAAVSWASLLVTDLRGAHFGAVRDLLGGILQVPWPAVAALTLLLPALLAWCAAAVAEGVLGVASAPVEAATVHGDPIGRRA